jgi:hypothetical protein
MNDIRNLDAGLGDWFCVTLWACLIVCCLFFKHLHAMAYTVKFLLRSDFGSVMAKLFQITDVPSKTSVEPHSQYRDTSETAEQILALMQAKWSHPTAKAMLEILHCTADKIFAMRR